MFDRSNQANLDALHQEVFNNTVHYPNPEATAEVLDKLNIPAQARTPSNSTNRHLTGWGFLEAVVSDPAEYALRVDTDDRRLLINQLASAHFETIPDFFRDELIAPGAIFNNNDAPNIRAAIIAKATSPASQAEQLFGDDTAITSQDWFAARDRGSL